MIEASPSAYLRGLLVLGTTLTHSRGGDLMRFYTNQHQCYCGIDLHARSMSVCLLSQAGAILLHRNLKAAPEPFRKAVAPYRDGLVVAVEGLFTWDLARRSLCARRYSLRVGSCPLYAGDSRRPSQTRHDRFAQDCHAAPGWYAPAGVCL